LGDGGRSEAEYNITFSESLKKSSREEMYNNEDKKA
jgi:hypothetical protein